MFKKKNRYIVIGVIAVFLLSLLVIELFVNKNEAEDYVETNNQETNISSMNDMSILTLGDSITWLDGNKVSGVESIIGYQQVLRETGATVFSYGVYGGTYSQKQNSSGKVKSIYQEIVINKTVNFSNLDTIILFGGTNDIGTNTPLGSVDSQDSYTTLGAINLIIDYLRLNNPNADIILCSPIYSSRENRLPAVMEQFISDLEKLSEKKNVYFVDMYNDLEIYESSANFLLYDGLHPNNFGMEIIGNKIKESIDEVRRMKILDRKLVELENIN
ncbi:SGNH/GDSL hydrolase family protein [uncultured Vagococcus sp.]|uniref:SGNH/GDSL hydrolase family protein n=1 Tax=uncultured Vagococcus sp. TaxID=189676 RepID=UPI00258ED263|nr:SGNH/GDSL hydrolase family protein [uncultured Vagococcus sp.]